MQLDFLYRHRFSASDRQAKDAIWRVLCDRFFSHYIPQDSTVLDVGAGYCEFINHISARRRIAVDANPDLKQFAAKAVEVHCAKAEEMGFLGDQMVDVVFVSNFFEHLPTKPALHQLVLELHRILKPGGRLLIMGPNIKYLPGKYWDYFDHQIPLTEKSVEELLSISGFEVEESLPRFMPYTAKSWLPKWACLVRLYLALRVLSFPLFGKQFFVVARKRQVAAPR